MKSEKDIRDRKEAVPAAGSDKTSKKCLSRRKFLSGSALAVGAAGATVAATGGLGLLSGSFASAAPTCATIPGVIKHPEGTWGYTPLDPAVCAERAYRAWYVGYCCYAVFDGIIGELQDALGSPYTNIDPWTVKFGHGGIAGWGTVCGTALGAGLAANFVAGKTNGEPIASDLMAYYSVTNLPVYLPVGTPVYPYTPPASASDSPLCHVSVGKWMKLSGNTFWTPERKERCARLAGDMAQKTAELLNDWDAGTYTSGAWGDPALAYTAITGQNNCTDCHGTSVPDPSDPSTW